MFKSKHKEIPGFKRVSDPEGEREIRRITVYTEMYKIWETLKHDSSPASEKLSMFKNELQARFPNMRPRVVAYWVNDFKKTYLNM